MPASKPKHEHRKIISISCSKKQLEQIDKLVKVNKFSSRSKYILSVLFEAIALFNFEIGEKLPKHSNTVKFQISCTPKQYEAIVSFEDRIPNFKRSRWIVYQLLKSY